MSLHLLAGDAESFPATFPLAAAPVVSPELSGLPARKEPGSPQHSQRAIFMLMAQLGSESTKLDVDSMELAECTRFVEELGGLQRQLEGARIAAISRIGKLERLAKQDPTGRAAKEISKQLGESRTVWDFVERSGKQSREGVRNDIRRAEAASELYPRFGSAMRAGTISADHLDVLRSLLTTPQLKEAATAGESFLLEHAVNEPVGEFRKTVKAWKFQVSPRAAEQQVRREARDETFSIFRENGGYRLSGWLSALNGTIVDQTLRETIGVPAKDDRRSVGQRNAEALVGMAQSVTARASTAKQPTAKQPTATQPEEGNSHSGRVASRGSARFQTLVHVPLSTLIQTEEAIHTGCGHLNHIGTASAVAARENHPGASGMSEAPSPDIYPLEGTRSLARAHAISEPVPSSGAIPSSRAVASSGAIPTVTGAPRCPVSGEGLGGRGRCLDGRADVSTEVRDRLGEIRSRIRAGVCPDLLEALPPATLTDGTPLAPSQLARMLCDSGISRVVFSAYGEPLDASKAQRRFSATQEKAIIARDRTCRYPGCARGVEYAEIHHAHEWDRGGPTVVDNAVLLCFHHHQYVHREDIVITHHAGGFIFTRKGGEIIGVRHHEAKNLVSSPGVPVQVVPGAGACL
ncbi:DUF222 domain-containing protein [Actinomycetaceae bacterium L2_0104]